MAFEQAFGIISSLKEKEKSNYNALPKLANWLWVLVIFFDEPIIMAEPKPLLTEFSFNID